MNGDTQQQQPSVSPKSRPVMFTGGVNNNVGNGIRLHFRGKGETAYCYNADLSKEGCLKLLRPRLDTLNTAESGTVHSVFRSKDVELVGSGTTLKYRAVGASSLTSLLTGLSGDPINFSAVGDWVFYANGTNQGAIYLTTMTACTWGTDPPVAGPTVAAGAAGNPNGTYQCAYRYKITLPDGTIVFTDLSDVTEVVTGGAFKIEWSAIAYPTFTGATTIQAELYRTMSGWADYYLITTLTYGTTTYSDDVTDAAAQLGSTFDETGYYGPPTGFSMLFYHAGADRVFGVIDGDVYWSEAGLYHTFVYDEVADEYENVNSVYLSNQPITAIIGFDEQMYIGCQSTWRRLRGTRPDSWFWESIEGAVAGPLGWRSCVVTQFGIAYPGNDSRLWLFNGFSTKRILDQYEFDTAPDSDMVGAYDRRFLYFYQPTEATYKELVIDTTGWPGQQMRPVQSSRDATAIFYDKDHAQMYVGNSSGQVQNGVDEDTEVTLSFRTADVPVAGLLQLEAEASLFLFCNTQGADLDITPVYDGVDQDPLDAVVTDTEEFVVVPITLGTVRTIGFKVSITTNQDIILIEPWFIGQEHDASPT